MRRQLDLADILDLRAYERERDARRAEVMALKRDRRVGVGPLVTLVFENRVTIWYQVQEMVRAERMLEDSQVLEELEAYNPLIPNPGELSATLFIELTTDEELREWLPKLVGIERSVLLVIGAGGTSEAAPLPSGDGSELVVRAVPDAEQSEMLTREAVTASVHYLRFGLGSDAIERFAREPVALAIDHPAYREATLLGDRTKASLLADLRGQ